MSFQMATAAGVESPQLFEFGGSLHGADLAIVSGMDKRTSTSRAGSLTSLTRVVRGFAEASLMVAGFAAAILLIGTPLALLVRGLYEGLSWLVGRGGETSALVDAFVSLFSIGGGVVLLAVFVRLLVGFFDWRRRFRARVSDAAAASP